MPSYRAGRGLTAAPISRLVVARYRESRSPCCARCSASAPAGLSRSGDRDSLYLATTNRLMGAAVNPRPARYDGIVWSPHLRTGILLARCNGRTFWTGNVNIHNEVGKVWPAHAVVILFSHSTRRYSARQERTGWTSPPDVSCKDSTRQHAVDGPLLSCKQQVGGSSPPASSQNRRSQACALAYGFPVLGTRATAARRALVEAPAGCRPARGRVRQATSATRRGSSRGHP